MTLAHEECRICKYDFLDGCEEPCHSCLDSTEIGSKWEPKEVNNEQKELSIAELEREVEK